MSENDEVFDLLRVLRLLSYIKEHIGYECEVYFNTNRNVESFSKYNFVVRVVWIKLDVPFTYQQVFDYTELAKTSYLYQAMIDHLIVKAKRGYEEEMNRRNSQ